VKLRINLLIAIIMWGFLSNLTFAGDSSVVGWWKFDKVQFKTDTVVMYKGKVLIPQKVPYVLNSVSENESAIKGNFYKIVAGVDNKALRLDGILLTLKWPLKKHLRLVEISP